LGAGDLPPGGSLRKSTRYRVLTATYRHYSPPINRSLDDWHTLIFVGFLSRLLVPRGVRRATHPVRSAKRAVTPKTIKQARRAMHPVDNAVYGLTRSLNTKPRKAKAATYNHGSCPVNHRTAAAAAARCRNP
jgi:hypothetical protein